MLILNRRGAVCICFIYVVCLRMFERICFCMKKDVKMECIETAFELVKLHHIQTWHTYSDLLCMAMFEYQHLCNGFDYLSCTRYNCHYIWQLYFHKNNIDNYIFVERENYYLVYIFTIHRFISFGSSCINILSTLQRWKPSRSRKNHRLFQRFNAIW